MKRYSGMPYAIPDDVPMLHHPTGEETFGWRSDDGSLSATWDVSLARELAKNHEPQEIILDEKARANALEFLGSVHVYHDHAMRSTRTDPIIFVVRFIPALGDVGGIQIDGCHRLYKAVHTNAPSIQAVYLTAEDEERCRICDYAPDPDEPSPGATLAPDIAASFMEFCAILELAKAFGVDTTEIEERVRRAAIDTSS